MHFTGEAHLRDIKDRDLPLLKAWRSDREIMRYLPSNPAICHWEEHWRWWGSNWHRGALRKIIETRILTSASVLYFPVGICLIKEDGETGLLVGDKEVWGQGIGTKALGLLLNIGPSMGIGPQRDLWAVIHPDNVASHAVFIKNGFAWDGAEIGRYGQCVYRRWYVPR